jgi:hypothetical protein
VPDPSTLIDIARTASTSAGTIVALVGGVLWKNRTRLRKVGHIIDDLVGQEARNGKPATPGIVEQVMIAGSEAKAARETAEVAVQQASATRLELGALSSQMGLIANAVGELQPNHGSTLHDAIREIHADTSRLAGRDPIAS